MKKLIMSLGLGASLLAVPAIAGANPTPEKFLYGDCKQFRNTEFFRCVTVDGQSVYTNQLPSCGDEEAFRKARSSARRRKMAQTMTPKGEQGSVIPAGRQGPTVVEVLPPDPSIVRPTVQVNPYVTVLPSVAEPRPQPTDCAPKRARMNRLIAAWDALVPRIPSPDEVTERTIVTIWKKGSPQDKQMDALDLEIGALVDDPCFAK